MTFITLIKYSFFSNYRWVAVKLHFNGYLYVCVWSTFVIGFVFDINRRGGVVECKGLVFIRLTSYPSQPKNLELSQSQRIVCLKRCAE